MTSKEAERNLNDDIFEVLNSNPGLMIRYDGIKVSELYGTYLLRDDSGVEQGRWEVRITIPTGYPFGFPELYETSNLIPAIPDRHMGADRLACTELFLLKHVHNKNGIRLTQFIEDYVKRYFSWQLMYEHFDRTQLKSWGHAEQGIFEYFYDKLRTRDHRLIHDSLEMYLTRREPECNQNCFCSSGKKYKACHAKIFRSISNEVGNKMTGICLPLFRTK